MHYWALPKGKKTNFRVGENTYKSYIDKGLVLRIYKETKTQ